MGTDATEAASTDHPGGTVADLVADLRRPLNGLA
jgi:hypothetical protein